MKRVLILLPLLACLLIPTAAHAEPEAATVGGCPVFPADNIWNRRVDKLPVARNSKAYIASIGKDTGMHPDFGSGLWDGAPIGIPYASVAAGQPKVPVTFDYADESDPGPYPIPADVAVEGGSDHHVVVVDAGACKLYEMWDATKQSDGSWHAGSGAIFDLNLNLLRPRGWTSADAAGLPILPGLVRHDEVASGAINHALRFTVARSRNTYLWPARHEASDQTSKKLPQMGQRFRLKKKFDISGFSRDTQIILTALKTYGMIVADNGANWYLSGAPDPAWNDDALVSELARVKGSAFEAVNEARLMVNPDSGQSK